MGYCSQEPKLGQRNSMVDPNTVFPFCKVIKRFFIRKSLQDGIKGKLSHLPQGLSSSRAPKPVGAVVFLNNG